MIKQEIIDKEGIVLNTLLNKYRTHHCGNFFLRRNIVLNKSRWLAICFVSRIDSYAAPSISSVVLLYKTSVELKRIEASQSGLQRSELAGGDNVIIQREDTCNETLGSSKSSMQHYSERYV